MNIRDALLYLPRQTSRWQILLIGVVVGAIPYLGFAVLLALLLPVAAATSRGEHNLVWAPPSSAGHLAERIVRVIGVTIAFAAAIVIAIIGWLIAAVIVEGWASGAIAAVGLGLLVAVAVACCLLMNMIMEFFTTRLAVTDSFRDSIDLSLATQVIGAHPRAWLTAALGPLLIALPGYGATWVIDHIPLIGGPLNWLVLGALTTYIATTELHLAGQAYRLSLDTIAKRERAVLDHLMGSHRSRASFDRPWL